MCTCQIEPKALPTCPALSYVTLVLSTMFNMVDKLATMEARNMWALDTLFVRIHILY